MQDDIDIKVTPRQVERVAFSIPEFCVRNHISPAKYHALKRAGRGPAEMRDGFWVRITAQSESDWQQAMTNPQNRKDIAARAESEALTKARGKKAGRLAAESSRHVSKRRKNRAA